MRPRWRGLLVVGPYLLVVVVGFLGLHSLEREAHRRCLDRATDRMVLRQVVDVATRSTGAPLDLRNVPGFDELDERVQTYLANLSDVIVQAPAAGPSLHDRLLAELPPITC